jgi:hypothetical protein
MNPSKPTELGGERDAQPVAEGPEGDEAVQLVGVVPPDGQEVAMAVGDLDEGDGGHRGALAP